RAARPGAGPGRLVVAALAAVLEHRGAADGDHVRVARRVQPELPGAAVTRRRGDRDAGVVVEGLVAPRRATEAVRDRDAALLLGVVVFGGAQGHFVFFVRLDHDDLAVGARGRDHVEVERLLEVPAVVRRRRLVAAVLVDDLQAAALRGARRQVVHLTEL